MHLLLPFTCQIIDNSIFFIRTAYFSCSIDKLNYISKELILNENNKSNYKISESTTPIHQLIENNLLNDFLLKICLNIKEFHSNNILISNLKPSNIFISQNFNCYFCDIKHYLLYTTSNRISDLPFNALEYISPEITLNREYDLSSDIWSLGCIIYFVLSTYHSYIFQAKNVFQMYKKQLHPSKLYENINISKKYKEILDMCLCYNKNDRKSIDEIIEYLEESKSERIKKKIKNCNNNEDGGINVIMKLSKELSLSSLKAINEIINEEKEIFNDIINRYLRNLYNDSLFILLLSLSLYNKENCDYILQKVQKDSIMSHNPLNDNYFDLQMKLFRGIKDTNCFEFTNELCIRSASSSNSMFGSEHINNDKMMDNYIDMLLMTYHHICKFFVQSINCYFYF